MIDDFTTYVGIVLDDLKVAHPEMYGRYLKEANDIDRDYNDGLITTAEFVKLHARTLAVFAAMVR